MDFIKEKIQSCDIISFDIFDTLLIRPYIKPWHLFLHIEEFLGINNFVYFRRLAEKKARKSSIKEDITIDDIYKNMPLNLQYVRDIEIHFEETVLKRNEFVFEIYEYVVENNKKIIFTSDMYLPKDALIKALTKNGYNTYSALYLSGEIGLSKRSGNLFKYILEKENIEPDRILHIGDSEKYDILKPTELGINTYKVYNGKELFLNNKNNQRFKKLYKSNKDSLVASITLALVAEKYLNNNILNDRKTYFRDFAYIIGGIVAYAFCRYIVENVSETDEILCIARDGYNIEKIINILKPAIKTHYIYAQRVFKDKFGLNGITTLDIQKNIEEYKRYLLFNNVDINKNIVVVDTGASSFSAQRILEKVLGKKLLGIYSIVDKFENIEKYNINCKTWVDDKNLIKCITSFIEFIFMAPEPPILDIVDCKPKHQESIHKREKELNELADIISEGLLEFANDMNNRFAELSILFNAKDVNKYVEHFICSLNKMDKTMFDSVYYPANVDNTKYFPVLRKIYKMSKHYKYYLARVMYNIKIKILKQYH